MRRRLSDERGMTLIEVMVASLILVVGIATVVIAVNGSRRLGQQAERKQQAISYAQADIESFRSMKYDDVMTLEPPPSGNPEDGSVLVVNVNGKQVLRVKPLGGLFGQWTYQRVVESTGRGKPQQETIRVGRSTGKVSRIVTWEDTCLLNTVCVGPATAKRVTVVVELDAVGGRPAPAPVIAQTVIADPTAM